MQTKKSYLTVMIFCAFMVLYFQQFRDGEERVDDHTVDKNQNDSITLKVEMPYIKKITNTRIFLDIFLWRGMFLDLCGKERITKHKEGCIGGCTMCCINRKSTSSAETVSTWSAWFLKITFLKLRYPRGITAVGHSLPNLRSGSIFVSLCK